MKLIIIVGLFGSGKTTLMNQIARGKNIRKFDDLTDFGKPIFHLYRGGDCIITTFSILNVKDSHIINKIIRDFVPNATIEWIWFENNPEQCKINIKKRKGPEMNKELEGVDRFSPRYKVPENVVARKVWVD